jgi:diguanylate cyclase (GGDEF)-like protein
MRFPDPKPLYRYLAGVSLIGFVVLATLLPEAARVLPLAGHEFAVIFLLVILGELLPIEVPRRDAEITTSTTFSFAALVCWGTPAAVIAQAVGSFITDVARKRPIWRSTFNIAQYTLSYGAAGAVLSLLSDLPHAGGSIHFEPTDLPAIGAAACTFFIVNNGLAGTASALADEAPILSHLLDDLVFQASTAAVLLGLAPIVVVAADFSLIVLPLIMLPLGAIYIGGWQAALNDHEALHDSLTGLPNRAYFRVKAEQAVRSRSRENGSLALMVMDLDRFKEVNDGLGHRLGDLLLREISPRLATALGEDCTVARLGGDEFAVLLPRISDPSEAIFAAERVTTAFAAGFAIEGFELDVGASIGIACWPDHGQDVDTLICNADAAMYQAKQGGNGYELYRSLHGTSSRDPLDIGAELRRAIEADEIEVHYQPQLHLNSGIVWGVEALARWPHPTRGWVMPGQFIPIAETTGLIRTLTMRVLDSSLRQWRQWHDDGIEVDLAVNLSAGDLLDSRLPDSVSALLRRWDVPPTRLTLEITESTVIADSKPVAEVLEALSALGIRLAIDDFGTGYSSVSYLRNLPVSEVKIDRTFVHSLGHDDRDQVIVGSVIELAHRLGLRAVAEGVETPGAMLALDELGCDLVQGYELAAPMPGSELAGWMEARESSAPLTPVSLAGLGGGALEEVA